MKKRADYDELTKKLNEFRMISLDKMFTGTELNAALKSLGFNTTVASRLAQKCFPFQKIGKGLLYAVPKDPIHRGSVVSIYEERNKLQKEYRKGSDSSNETNEAWETLIKAGVIKPKFNLSKLKTEYPEIYLKCLDYEIVKQ